MYRHATFYTFFIFGTLCSNFEFAYNERAPRQLATPLDLYSLFLVMMQYLLIQHMLQWIHSVGPRGPPSGAALQPASTRVTRASARPSRCVRGAPCQLVTPYGFYSKGPFEGPGWGKYLFWIYHYYYCYYLNVAFHNFLNIYIYTGPYKI